MRGTDPLPWHKGAFALATELDGVVQRALNQLFTELKAKGQ